MGNYSSTGQQGCSAQWKMSTASSKTNQKVVTFMILASPKHN